MIKNILTNKKIDFDYIVYDDLSDKEKSAYDEIAKENNILNFPIIIDEKNNIIDIKDINNVF
jgi:glutaredoxin